MRPKSFIPATSRVTETNGQCLLMLTSAQGASSARTLSFGFRSFFICGRSLSPHCAYPEVLPHFPCGERNISPTSLSRLTRHLPLVSVLSVCRCRITNIYICLILLLAMLRRAGSMLIALDHLSIALEYASRRSCQIQDKACESSL